MGHRGLRQKKKSRTDSLEHQRTRSTHRKDTTTCVGGDRAPSVTTFISPLLCQTCDGVGKEEEVIRKHKRESFLALSIEAAALWVTYRSDVDNCYRNEGNKRDSGEALPERDRPRANEDQLSRRTLYESL